MDKKTQQILMDSRHCVSQQQNSRFVFLVNFESIWREERLWGEETIKNFPEFKKQCEFFAKQKGCSKVQIILKKFPSFKQQIFDPKLMEFSLQQNQGYLIRKTNVIGIEVSPPVYYQSRIFYRKICDCG